MRACTNTSGYDAHTSGAISGTDTTAHHRVLRLVDSSNGCPDVLSLEQGATRAEVYHSMLRNLQQIPGCCQPCNACAVLNEPEVESYVQAIAHISRQQTW